MRTFEFPRAAATSGCSEGAVPKVGTGGWAVTAASPVGKGMEIFADSPTGVPATSIKLVIVATVASAVIECILKWYFGAERTIYISVVREKWD